MHSQKLAEPLSVRLLVAGTGRRTSVLLGLAATRIYKSTKPHQHRTGSNEGTIEAHEDVLDLTLGLLVDVYQIILLTNHFIHFW